MYYSLDVFSNVIQTEGHQTETNPKPYSTLCSLRFEQMISNTSPLLYYVDR